MQVSRFGLKSPRGYLSATETQSYSNFVDDAIYFASWDTAYNWWRKHKQYLTEQVVITEFKINFPRLLTYRIFA